MNHVCIFVYLFSSFSFVDAIYDLTENIQMSFFSFLTEVLIILF